MPTYARDFTVRLKDTDAAGVIYFASQLVFAHETFEAFLDGDGRSFGRMFAESDFALPVVRCEADYRHPLRVGDRVSVEMAVGEIGTSSFALDYAFRRDGDEVGRCRIVHASIDRGTRRSIPLPAEVRDLLASP